jgi:hypothetical protein
MSLISAGSISLDSTFKRTDFFGCYRMFATGRGVTKRCRLSWLTNSALVYHEPKCGGVGVVGSQPMSTAVHMEPKFTLEI